MKNTLQRMGWMLTFLGLNLTSACDTDPHEVYFTGYVYDGVRGNRISDYELELVVGDDRKRADVDADGRYNVGPLNAWDDFSIHVTANGYANLRSHNQALEEPGEVEVNETITTPLDDPEAEEEAGDEQSSEEGADETESEADAAEDTSEEDSSDEEGPKREIHIAYKRSRDRTLHVDAVLIPTGFRTEEAKFTVGSSDPELNEGLSGFARFRPTGRTSLESAFESHIDSVWIDDEALQARNLVREFSNGEFLMEATALEFGIIYEVTVFGVLGHQINTFEYDSGAQLGANFFVSPLLPPLELEEVVPKQSSGELEAIIELRFNQAISLDNVFDLDSSAEIVDDALELVNNAANDELQRFANPDIDEDDIQENGVQITGIGTDTLVFRWNRNVGMADIYVPVREVIYKKLDKLLVGPASQPGTIPLSKFVGASELKSTDIDNPAPPEEPPPPAVP